LAIDENTVRRVAHLARLALPQERIAPMAQEISGILAWIEQLGEVDVDNVAPMASTITDAGLALREDRVTEGANTPAILANAPKSEDGFFVVPKVVE
jgi:aspartyl-tRNA(Asn)/glutamyl-tRNA(Gln) amidotransferase subunit C